MFPNLAIVTVKQKFEFKTITDYVYLACTYTNLISCQPCRVYIHKNNHIRIVHKPRMKSRKPSHNLMQIVDSH